MRSSRLYRKRNKFKGIIIITQVLAIWYVTIVSASVLTSSTGAYFSDTSNASTSIKAGTWWDGSILSFTGKPTQNVKACPPTEISVGIKNSGFAMIEPTQYEIYYVEHGNPKQNGSKIASGEIEPIEQNGNRELKFSADKVGEYMFKTLQSPGFDNNFEKRAEIWSEKIMVKCLDKKDKQEDDKTDSKILDLQEDIDNVEEIKNEEELDVPTKKANEETEVVETETEPEITKEESVETSNQNQVTEENKAVKDEKIIEESIDKPIQVKEEPKVVEDQNTTKKSIESPNQNSEENKSVPGNKSENENIKQDGE